MPLKLVQGVHGVLLGTSRVKMERLIYEALDSLRRHPYSRWYSMQAALCTRAVSLGPLSELYRAMRVRGAGVVTSREALYHSCRPFRGSKGSNCVALITQPTIPFAGLACRNTPETCLRDELRVRPSFAREYKISLNSEQIGV